MLGRKRKAPPEPVPLGDAVRDVAACPCPRHHESLADALGAADQLILRLVGDPGPTDVSAGSVEGGEIQVATAVAPNGSSFLHAFSDIEAASARFPDARFVGVAPEDAFRLSILNGNQGLLVSTSGEDDPWAAVTVDGIARLLGLESS